MRTTPLAALCAVVAALSCTLSVSLAAPTPTPLPQAVSTPAARISPTPAPRPSSTARAMQAAPVSQPAGGNSPSPLPTELSLAQAEAIALASSPELEIGRAVVNQNAAGIGIARSAELPNISADANYSRAKSNIVTGGRGSGAAAGGGSSVPVVFTQNNGSVVLRQLVLDGGRVNAQVQAARFSTDAAKLTLLRQIQSVLFAVAQEYFTALQARHQLQAAVRSLEVAKVQQRLVEAQFHAGVASKADLLTAQLPVAQAEVGVATAQNGEALNVASLLTTMGVPATTPVTLKDDTAVAGLQPKLDAVLDEALHERTDLSAARATVQQAHANVRAAKLAAFPLVGATASSGSASTAPNGQIYAANWSIGASVSVPLYSGGLIRSQADQARAIEQQAEASLKSTQLNVYQNVQQAFLQLGTASSSLNAAKVALDQARVVLDVTNAQYKAGVTTLPLLLNAQSQLTTAQSNYVQALYAYKIAEQNLLFAEGTIAPS